MAFQIEGLKELQKKLQKISKIAENPDCLLKAAQVIQKYSMQNAPVKTGFLRNSHKVRKSQKGAMLEVAANYALWVEMGTSKMAGKHYLKRAINEHGEEAVNATAEEVKKRLEKIT